MRRRATAAHAVLVMFAVLIAAVGCQLVGRSSSQGLQGRLLWPKDGDLWAYDLSSKQQTRMTELPGGAAVTGATWSPDGKSVVYAQFWRRPNERSSGSDLFIANADGSNPRLFAERDAPNTVLESPEWGDSGRVYYTIRRVASGRENQSIVRQTEGGEPEVLVDNAYSAAVSPDETTLVYVRNSRAGQTMFKMTFGQAGDGCVLISDQVFQYLSVPRFSPDGKRVALGGSGEPNLTAPSECGGDPRSKAAGVLPLALDLLALFEPGTAYAHGLPADIYSLNADGSDMRRIAEIKDDDPSVTYSPDGTKLAIFGVAALFVVDANGGPTEKLVDQGGYGAIDWTR